MKKRILILGVAAALLSACTGNKGVEGGYTITGTADGTADGDTVYYAHMVGYFGYEPLDTAIVKNGEFFFTGKQEGADIRFVIAFHEGSPVGAAQLVVENTDYKVTIYKGEDVDPEVVGGKAQELWSKFEKALREEPPIEVQQASNIYRDSLSTPEQRAEAEAILEDFSKSKVNFIRDFISENNHAPFSDMVLGYYSETFEQNGVSVDSLVEVLAAAGLPNAVRIAEDRAKQQKTEVGQPFIDFTAATLEGDSLQVSTVVAKNKLTLIDFWASWCAPCRAELPNVQEVYHKYRKQGFEVVGVSLDESQEAWAAAVKQLGLNWINVSDLGGDSHIADQYNIHSIPSNVLVNQAGEIVAKNLRGEELASKVADELVK